MVLTSGRFARTERGRRLPADRCGAVVLGGDYQGLGIARSLGRRGVPVCVIDDERSITTASRYATRTLRFADLHGEQQILDALAAARDRFGLDGWVLYPTRDEMVTALAKNREELSRWFRVPTPDLPAVRACWDKRETYRLAQQLGVPTPRCWVPGDEAGLAAVDASGPLVIKPAIKENFFYQTGVKAWRADGPADLAARFREAAGVVDAREVIVQEMVPGSGREQYSYCAFFRDGRPVASMTVRRRRQHPSDFGRASTFVETVDVPELDDPSRRFLGAIGFYGLVELEYKRDHRDGLYKLLDVNARTWGYHSLGAAAGIDFPYLVFQDQVGGAARAGTARTGVRWIRLVTDVPNALLDMRRGTIRAREYLGSLRGVDTEAVFSWRDPLPGLYELMLLPYLAVKRGL
jgi:predicted ATP-grasp superfamily ATP-dependent carboligase